MASIQDGPMHFVRAGSIACTLSYHINMYTVVHSTVLMIIVPYSIKIEFCKLITSYQTVLNCKD